MEKQQHQQESKKCFCARCFLPIESSDNVHIGGQNFHSTCCTCCVCQTIPTMIKMFYGHVFCGECFRSHVLDRFKGESPRMHSESWWMQWAPGARPALGENGQENKDHDEVSTVLEDSSLPEESPKKCICARCLQAVDQTDKVEIGGQSFHSQCATCYCCRAVPKDKVKIYCGEVFCEECFNRAMAGNAANTQELRSCCEQLPSNGQSRAGSDETSAPSMSVMQAAYSPLSRCGEPQSDWLQNNEARRSTTPAYSIGDSTGTWDLSFEARTESDLPGSEAANKIDKTTSAVEKIENLTKYLHGNAHCEDYTKKWKNFVEFDDSSVGSGFGATPGWAGLQGPRTCAACPQCLWQCGPIYVNSGYLQKHVCCGREL